VIQEFVHVHARRRAREAAARLGRRYAAGLAPLLLTEAVDLDRGLRLFAANPRLDAADAVLAAVVLRTEADALVSADRGFREVRGLSVIDPGSSSLSQLLG
jgi:predicted nucleic acid-binding protein